MRVVTGVFPRLLSGLSTTGAGSGSGSATGSSSGSCVASTSDEHSVVYDEFISFLFPGANKKYLSYINIAVMLLETCCLANAFTPNARTPYFSKIICPFLFLNKEMDIENKTIYMQFNLLYNRNASCHSIVYEMFE